MGRVAVVLVALAACGPQPTEARRDEVRAEPPEWTDAGSIAWTDPSCYRLLLSRVEGKPIRHFTLLSTASDGSDLREEYVSAEGPDLLYLVVSPDGTQIAYTVEDFYSSWDLHVLDLATGRSRRLTENEGTETAMEWHLSGEYLAFGFDDRIKVMRLSDKTITDVDAGYGPRWSPDGTRIAYTFFPPEGKTERVAVTDGIERSVVDDSSGRSNSLPAWSGDAAALYYLRLKPGGGPHGGLSDLMKFPLSSKSTTEVSDPMPSDEGVTGYDISVEDEVALKVLVWEEEAEYLIVQGREDPVIIDRPGSTRLSNPRWSPDGARLYFEEWSNTGESLWSWDKDGGERRLFDLPQDTLFAGFIPCNISAKG